jgi:hypothetical protein
MKRMLITALWAALFALSQMSCTPIDDSNDPNVIIDPKGIKIELSWSNSATNPAEKTDLDLMLMSINSNKTLLENSNWSKFETLDLLAGAISTGTYDLGVYVNTIDRQGKYTLTYTGLSTGKKWAKTYGPIYINDRYATLKPATVTVSSGNKYTFN